MNFKLCLDISYCIKDPIPLATTSFSVLEDITKSKIYRKKFPENQTEFNLKIVSNPNKNWLNIWGFKILVSKILEPNLIQTKMYSYIQIYLNQVYVLEYVNCFFNLISKKISKIYKILSSCLIFENIYQVVKIKYLK